MAKDILTRLAESSQNESSHELYCRCLDAAEEVSRLRDGLRRFVSLYESEHDEIPARPAWLAALLPDVVDSGQAYLIVQRMDPLREDQA